MRLSLVATSVLAAVLLVPAASAQSLEPPGLPVIGLPECVDVPVIGAVCAVQTTIDEPACPTIEAPALPAELPAQLPVGSVTAPCADLVVPEAPEAPEAPAVPEAPVAPDLPAAPSAPELPTVPALPSIDGVALPGLPSAPIDLPPL